MGLILMLIFYLSVLYATTSPLRGSLLSLFQPHIPLALHVGLNITSPRRGFFEGILPAIPLNLKEELR